MYWTSAQRSGTGHADAGNAPFNDNYIPGATGYNIAVHGGFLYLANPGGWIARVPILDPTAPELDFMTGLSTPLAVAVDGAHVYWTQNNGNIGRANLDGSAVDPAFITGVQAFFGLAVDNAHIYWTRTAGSVARANLDGSGVNTAFITGQSNPLGVAVDQTYIYWATNNTHTDVHNSIGRAKLDGSAIEPNFVTEAGDLWGLAVDQARIYWTNRGSPGSVGSARLDGSDPEREYVFPLGDPVGVAADDSVAGATSPQTLDSNLTASVGPYLAMSGGALSFGRIVPAILGSTYNATASLSVSTSSATGVVVRVAPSSAANVNLGIPGATIKVQGSEPPPRLMPLAAPGVEVVRATAPVNQAYLIPFRLTLPPGTVLRSGDLHSEPITYTATAALP